ncbi:hypothetical protein LTR86_009674 [Recurvomyces mirabilis]|nr:hypothetical protein LTR86_009674 [Recurvomyces mirabilis]
MIITRPPLTRTCQTLIYGAVAIALGFAAYQVYTSMSATSSPATTSSPSSTSSKRSPLAAAAPKKPAYTPQGDPQSWSVDDMKKFLNTRNMGGEKFLKDSSKNELLAMVESKIHEPGNTDFSDPQEWSVEDMKTYLKANNMGTGHGSSRMELLAMVESKMHEPKF